MGWSTFEPLVLSDVVLIGNENGELCAFRHQDGKRVWSRKIEGVPRSLSASRATLYIGTLQGFVYATRIDDQGGPR